MTVFDRINEDKSYKSWSEAEPFRLRLLHEAKIQTTALFNDDKNDSLLA